MSVATTIASLFAAYLLGSLPSAYIWAHVFGRGDVTSIGSGNVGGMNAFRNVHPAAGLLTGLTDLLKGSVAVYTVQSWAVPETGADWLPLAAGVAAVVGHNYMLFLGLRGGKGLGTTVGVLAVLWPEGIAWLLISLLLGTILLRDTNAGSGAGAFLLPLLFWYRLRSVEWAVFGAALAVVIASKHVRDFRAYISGRREVM